MKFLLWLLGLFALAVALTLAAHNPGYVLLAYPPYRVEMSLSLFVVELLMLFVLGLLAIRLIFAALNLPAFVRRFRDERAHARARAAMTEALGAYFEGRYATAEKKAAQAIELGDHSAINPIVAARAAHELREFDRRDAYLLASEGTVADSPAMRLMAVAKFSLDQRQPQAALDALEKLRATAAKKHVGEMHLELKAQQQTKNWDAVLELTGQLEKRNAIDVNSATQLRQQAWLEKIRAGAHDLPDLLAVWGIVPAEFRQRAMVAAVAARAFIHLNDYQNSRQILTDSLNAEWDSDLARLYGDCTGGDVTPQIEQAERWLKEHADDAGLLLALGKLCLHQKLWGKAQNYLEASASVAPGREAYNALGHMAQQLQKPNEAFEYFQKAMRLVEARSGD